MALDDYQISFGGLTIGDGTDFDLNEVTGIESFDVRDSDVPFPNQWGSIAGVDEVNGRKISIDVEIAAGDDASLAQAFESAFLPSDEGEFGTLVAKFPGRDELYFQARVRRRTRRRVIEETLGLVRIGVELFAPDPRAYSNETFSEAIPAYTAGTEALELSTLSRAGYATLDGSAGCYISTPDDADYTGSGTIRWMAKLTLADWTPSANMTVASHYLDSTNRGWLIRVNTSGQLVLNVSADGSATTFSQASSALGITDGDTYWVGVQYVCSTGALDFYKAAESLTPGTDFTGWTSVSSHSVAAATPFNAATVIELGSYNSGGSQRLTGSVHQFKMVSDGTVVADFHPDLDADNGDTSFVSSTTGETWTLNGAASLAGGSSRHLATDLTLGSGADLAFDFTGVPAVGEVVLVNDGNVDTYPTIVFTPAGAGALTEYRVSNLTTGVTFTCTAAIPPGQTLTADMAAIATPKAGLPIALEGETRYGSWSQPRTPLALVPGNNTIRFEVISGTATGAIATVTWRNAWL